jgi:hypothetical protein
MDLDLVFERIRDAADEAAFEAVSFDGQIGEDDEDAAYDHYFTEAIKQIIKEIHTQFDIK